MNIRYAGASEIRSVSDHEQNRTPDGASAIDPDRCHLNQVLHGPATQQAALDALWASGVKRPAAQAEKPYVQIVLSASPDFFRDEGQGPGEWNQDRLQEWLDATMKWLRDEYGDDLVHVSLHLDEDTPHLHVLVVPTYAKAPRRPGRQKRGETPEQFEERKRAVAEGAAIRTAGRSSCPQWSRSFARREARKSYHAAVEGLGLGYGKDFVGEGEPSPRSQTTGLWVRKEAVRLRAEAADMEMKRRASVQARWDARRERRGATVQAESILATARAEAVAEARAKSAAFEALAREIEQGTLARGQDGTIQVSDVAALRPGLPFIGPALRAAVDAAEVQRRDVEAAAKARAAIEEDQAAIAKARAEAEASLARTREAEAAVAAKDKAIQETLDRIAQKEAATDAAQKAADSFLERASRLYDRVVGWLRRDKLPPALRVEARQMLTEAGWTNLPKATVAEMQALASQKPREEAPRPRRGSSGDLGL